MKYTKLYSNRGFTLVELLIALLLAGAVTAAALRFYVSEHNNLIAQHNISDMQQNLRVASSSIANELRNAGAGMPIGIPVISSSDTNPDTLITRRTSFGGNLAVGDHTQKKQASPIHIDNSADVTAFSANQRAYIWYGGVKQGEWFTITKVADNAGSGWKEIHHQGQELQFDPKPGDFVLSMNEVKFYINASDTAKPLLMQEVNGGAAQTFAEYVNALDLRFVLTTLDTVNSPGLNDTVLIAQINLSAHTAEVDTHREDFNQDGRRRRSLATEVLIRNNRQ